jgi:phage terminase large subunit-like protein
VPGALWNRALIEETRWPVHKPVPDLIRIAVAIDPAASSGEEADETGIIVAGKDADGHGYVLADQSGQYAPTEWARTAIGLYRQYKADRIVAEVNNGGDIVEATVRMVDPNVSYAKVHASRGKVMRAEPVAALYEQHRVHHVGAFPTLEDQQCGFAADFDRASAGFSPDRVDALVWALTDLLVEEIASWGIYETTRRKAEAVIKARLATAEAGRPKPEPAPGSLEYQALHPEWKPEEE